MALALVPACAGGPGVETAKVGTEDAGTVGDGVTEVVSSVSVGRTDRSFDEDRDRVERARLGGIALLLEGSWGLSDTFDARITGQWREVLRDDSDEFADGLGNLSFTAKWTFHESHDGAWSFAWLPGLTAPFGRATRTETKVLLPGQEFWSLDNLVAATYAAGPFNVSADLAYLLPLGDEREEVRGIVLANAGAGLQVTPWFQPILEVGYTSGIVAGIVVDADTISLTPGAIFTLSDTTRLDFGVTQTAYGKNEDVLTQVTVGLSSTF